MGFFSSLFGGGGGGGGGSIDLPDPPQLRLDDYELLLSQIDDLIGEYDGIKTGDNMFDAVKFLYEPQRANLERAFGLGAPGTLSGPNSSGATNDLFARSGTIPRTLSQMNQTGTLDAGTAGVIRGQLESEMNRQDSGLFGQAKQIQRGDYFNALNKLEGLFPQRFEARNIPNVLDFNNSMLRYNNDVNQISLNSAFGALNSAGNNNVLGSLFGSGSNLFGDGGGLDFKSLLGMFGNGDPGGGGRQGGVPRLWHDPRDFFDTPANNSNQASLVNANTPGNPTGANQSSGGTNWGQLGGAAIGALLGSLIAPGVGTSAGATIGGSVGGGLF